ncbi:hypothetical protein ED388_06145 [Muribaculaceae bacterium Isolate-007 (NCI)]|uniref:carboxypeptidase-like regulatory domain-containing protein n=1 Tax=Muribaculum intestinale TaxID=1796646 RepID=UPI000F4AC760|nr:carboxypeptidase-like regulatory domain-containing protein [Muribaculum intestinale]ROT10971.1 hypothetical protein EEL42_01545 [Muribaculaceae bacterium Isolate-100 (HZI)]RXE65723.1 hypothetical protein ED388_06145 [Muribaculaceae bacterium Isolate-007 (NCI)]
MSVNYFSKFRRGMAMSAMVCAVTVAQGAVVKGTVTDPDGEPLIGARVEIKGTKVTVITDVNGDFRLDADPKQSITVSYIGYSPATYPVGDRTSFDVVLQPSSTMLDETVVVTRVRDKEHHKKVESAAFSSCRFFW